MEIVDEVDDTTIVISDQLPVQPVNEATDEIEESYAGTRTLLETDCGFSSSSFTGNDDVNDVSMTNVNVTPSINDRNIRNYDIDPNDIDSSDDEDQINLNARSHGTDEQVNDAETDGATSGEDEFGEFTSANLNSYVTLGDSADENDDNNDGTAGFIVEEPLFIPSDRTEHTISDTRTCGSKDETLSFTMEEAFPPLKQKAIPRIAPLGTNKIAIIKTAMAGLNFKKKVGLDALCDQILMNKPRYGDELDTTERVVGNVNVTPANVTSADAGNVTDSKLNSSTVCLHVHVPVPVPVVDQHTNPSGETVAGTISNSSVDEN